MQPEKLVSAQPAAGSIHAELLAEAVMAISVRTRFEVFKRDDFRCQYCGQRSPEVVLEVDHIVAVTNGGSDDPINLRTSCWACNSGKSDKPLDAILTGEDPHDRALMLLERERQLEEYNVVLAMERSRRTRDAQALVEHWNRERGVTGAAVRHGNPVEFRWLLHILATCPREQVRHFMDYAIFRGFTDSLRYVMACVRNWHKERAEPAVTQTASDDIDIDATIQSYVRDTAIEQVMVKLREADYWRRQLGVCPHDPTCTSTMDCVQRQTYFWLDVEPPF